MNIGNLQRELERLSPAKRALLEKRFREAGIKSSTLQSIPRRQNRDIAPLSFAQERLWFLNQLEPDSPVYNEPRALHLTGRLNVEALERALNAIVQRHETLRTMFVMINGAPMQRIAEDFKIEVPIINLQALNENVRDTETHRLIEETICRPFDVSKDCVLRTLLLRLSEDEHIFVLVRHHIASDGWSSRIFWQEFESLYRAFSSGQAADLPQLPIQYADFATWQRQWLQGEVLESQLSYWRKQLSDLSPLQLPIDWSCPQPLNPCGGVRTFSLSPEVSMALRTFSRKEGATLFMTLLAAFQALLYRYTGQEDVAVGSPIANRNRTETEGLIGFFANTLVIRTDLSHNPTFRELLDRVRNFCLNAYSNQDLPFEKLVEELHPDRNLNRNPLFQVTFQLNSISTKQMTLPDLSVEQIQLDLPMSKFDLSLSMTDRKESISGRMIYNTKLFESATIERMVGHFQVLLEGIVANPDQCISELPLLTDAEKHQLLVEWNNTKTDYPKNKCIHTLFEEQVEKTPDAIALVFENQQLTYRELNNRSNQLAHYLQKLGVGPDILVGICLDRSLDMIVGLLAILKAGGAYVPLDPSYPNERLDFMLNDARVQVLLTQEKFLSSINHQNVVCLDRDRQEIDKQNTHNPQSDLTANNLAYVIYTSGSTGKPKGTLISHSNVARLFHATDAWFHFDSNDTWTLFHSFAFDFSVWEIWGALFHGGKLVILPQEITRSPREFAVVLIRHQVTMLNQTPSAFRQLIPVLTENNHQGPLALRYVIFGGEALELQSLEPWFNCYGDENPKLINMYGITETTVHVTYRPITRADATPGTGSVIGRPIPDLRVYLLDRHQSLVPIGVPGEIYVGGAGVAKGYLGREALNAERFIADRFSDRPGAKLYRSGDLARWLPNGELEYLGRIDNQVKIRGYRIEPGEIEAVLAQHPAVRQAVVLAREDTPEDKRLVAYILTANASAPSVHDLRSYIQHKLPEYMAPSAFVFLDSLPLTPNGKLDRKALPAPDQTRPELDDAFVAPRTPVEEVLANIWAEVLKVEKVGIHDNFFHLGGHSLLATQVVSRVNHFFQTDLPLRRLFETPTIAGLADSVQASMGKENGSRSLQPIMPVPRSNDIPLSFAQERLWFLDRLDPDSPTYNVPAAFRLTGDLNVNALEQSLNEVVRRHESLRTVFATVNDNPVQQILPSLTFSLTPIDLSNHPESECESALQTLIKEEALRPFDLSHGPLIRACLWRLAAQDHVLALNMHHIISDGWSLGVLFRELSALYQGYCAGKLASLPDLPTQYADYSVWQRGWLQGENLDIQLSYWRKQLDGLSTLQLPTDHPRPPMQTYRGSSRPMELSTQLSQALKGLSQREGVTLFMTLLAAFQVLLSRYCGQSDIAVGSPIAGRTRRETEGLIGFLVNTLVLRSDLSNNPTFKELLRQIHETTLEAYTHQDLPFEKLVEELNPERNTSLSPLFQVLFVLQNNADQPLEFENLTVSPIRTGGQVAKFDLSLSMSDRQGNLRAALNFNTDLFDASTIERMVGHLQVLLEGIVANPEQPIGDVPLLTEAEEHQLLLEWNDSKTDYPKDKCIHQLFEEQVEKTPNAIALVFEDQQVSYRELNRRANQLAHYLISAGVEPETAVGIYLDRSIELPVALLAVLKAGVVYIPVDPSYPIERAAFIFKDVQARFVVTTQALSSLLSLSGARTITLDTELPKLDGYDHSNPRLIVGSESPAYILYTSGSTGTPKGVVMGHRALTNLISWQVKNFDRGLPARTLQFAPLGFDVSIQEMFSTWCSGGTLYLIGNELRQDGSSLLRYIDTQSIERLFLPFVGLQHFAEIAVNEDCTPRSLREIVTAGEQLRLTNAVRQFLDRLENCRLYNQYGPTESHVVTEYTVNPPFQQEPDLPPIGRPIANTQIYILDRHLHPVPIGVTGELHIGGDGLARGYLNRPELTREKFIANPFSGDPGDRLYKTGDLARYLPDGNIEFLGRVDNQVKIRGYRIEPGEIETLLAEHPNIQQAVVIAREDTPGDKRLAAYLVKADGAAPSVHDLRSYLQHKLPEYMVPSALVFLDSLPLTPNGKLDRKALPAPDLSRPEPDDTFAAPRTPIEEMLAEIWCEVLKLDKVGIHENFFHLGGHSLLATQVVSRIINSFSTDLPLREIFEAPTIAALALKLQPYGDNGEKVHQQTIIRVPRERYKT